MKIFIFFVKYRVPTTSIYYFGNRQVATRYKEIFLLQILRTLLTAAFGIMADEMDDVDALLEAPYKNKIFKSNFKNLFVANLCCQKATAISRAGVLLSLDLCL